MIIFWFILALTVLPETSAYLRRAIRNLRSTEPKTREGLEPQLQPRLGSQSESIESSGSERVRTTHEQHRSARNKLRMAEVGLERRRLDQLGWDDKRTGTNTITAEDSLIAPLATGLEQSSQSNGILGASLETSPTVSSTQSQTTDTKSFSEADVEGMRELRKRLKEEEDEVNGSAEGDGDGDLDSSDSESDTDSEDDEENQDQNLSANRLIGVMKGSRRRSSRSSLKKFIREKKGLALRRATLRNRGNPQEESQEEEKEEEEEAAAVEPPQNEEAKTAEFVPRIRIPSKVKSSRMVSLDYSTETVEGTAFDGAYFVVPAVILAAASVYLIATAFFK